MNVIQHSLDLDSACLSIKSFVASRHPIADSCGHNGLPLTPNSIAILGQARKLTNLSHPNICVYIDSVRGKHERIVIVSETFKNNLQQVVSNKHEDLSEKRFLELAKQILSGLNYLHEQNIVHVSLELSSIHLDSSENVKLYDYGSAYMMGYGLYVAFPVFNPRFVAPEVLIAGKPEMWSEDITSSHDEEELSRNDQSDTINKIAEAPVPKFDSKCDTWSFGIVMACLALRITKPWSGLKMPQILRKLSSFASFHGNVLERFCRENDCLEKLEGIPENIRNLIQICLEPDPLKRPSVKDILMQDPFHGIDSYKENPFVFPSMKLRCLKSAVELYDTEEMIGEDKNEKHALKALTVHELYYLWKLAGGDIFSELRKNGLMVTMPSILSLPKIVLCEGHLEGQVREKSSLLDPVILPLPLDQLKGCLKDVPLEDCYPLLLPYDGDKEGYDDQDETAKLPLIIKEADVRYQFKRIIVYKRILQGYPYFRSKLWDEARVDICPFYRAQTWAALLGINSDTETEYREIDKETWTPTDRQIEVDIPRCHQYNNLLSSPEGHRKFKRVLKAWIATNPQYVYWQGLDSLCAPFLYLNFNDEALAFACLSAFIPKYLYGMFQKDNAAVIQEYLAKFSHVQAFHHAELFNHLDDIGFIPDLYAIPWILTMFAHVFPLHNIFHLWDKLLLGDSAFPLCIGMAILLQLEERLMQAEFNDCILLFSDLPAIDIEKCVCDSIRLFCTTPKSIIWRKYGSPPSAAKNEQKFKNQSSESQKRALLIDSITLAEQKSEKVARISGAELLDLLGTGVNGQQQWQAKQLSIGNDSRPKVLLVDIRPLEDFKRGTIGNSVHIPASSAFNEEDQLFPEYQDLLTLRKGKIVCLVGSQNTEEMTIKFAERLLKMNINRLCTLHRGIEIFKPFSNVWHVPT